MYMTLKSDAVFSSQIGVGVKRECIFLPWYQHGNQKRKSNTLNLIQFIISQLIHTMTIKRLNQFLFSPVISINISTLKQVISTLKQVSIP